MLPMCRTPVGLGAKRVLIMRIAILSVGKGHDPKLYLETIEYPGGNQGQLFSRQAAHCCIPFADSARIGRYRIGHHTYTGQVVHAILDG